MVEPEILLLDEPLSNLDAKLREQMRVELKRLQRRTGITFVYVTHDQAEALALSDHIAVLHRGRLLFQGTPAAVRENPEVQEAYLGSPDEHQIIRAAARHRTGRVRLRADRDIARH